MHGSSSFDFGTTIPSDYFWPGGVGDSMSTSIGANGGICASSARGAFAAGLGGGSSSSSDAFGGGALTASGRNSFTDGLVELANGGCDDVGGGGGEGGRGGMLVTSSGGSMGTGDNTSGAGGAGAVVAGFITAGPPASPIDRSLKSHSRSVSPLALGGSGISGVGGGVQVCVTCIFFFYSCRYGFVFLLFRCITSVRLGVFSTPEQFLTWVTGG